ncbi:MAG: P1 family peptidase [Caulobacterales bacterium]
MARPGARNSLTDVPGVLVGCAADVSARTGVTVIAPEMRAVCAVDVRGGGPGTRETDALAAENLVDAVDAVVLSGGSVYGLAAADGVASALGAAGRGYRVSATPGVPPSPIVPAAILFDLSNGGDKAWGAAPPYRDLGAAAFAAAGAEVPLGNAGAGYGAVAGALKGGQGTASIVTPDGFVVGALACVNSFGSVVQPGTRAFWAWPFEIDGEFGGARPWDEGPPPPLTPEDWGLAKRNPGARQNTTIGLVAVNADLTPAEARRMAQMASAGFARAIRPVFAPFDGDVVFALATGGASLGVGPERPFALARIGSLAADALARAVARGVHAADPLGAAPAWRDLR